MTVGHDNPYLPGDRVRSFYSDNRTLSGSRACYIEGIVLRMEAVAGRCVISVDREVWRGHNCPQTMTGSSVGYTVRRPLARIVMLAVR